MKYLGLENLKSIWCITQNAICYLSLLSKIAIVFILPTLLSGCGYASVSFNSYLSKYDDPVVKTTAAANFDTWNHKNVAVLVQPAENVPVRRIEDHFIVSLINKGYQVASRSDIDHLLRELNFQNTFLSPHNIARVGKIMNVSAVLIVDVTQSSLDYLPQVDISYNSIEGELYIAVSEVSVRIVDVESAQVLWVGTRLGRSADYCNSDCDAVQRETIAWGARKLSEILP